MCLGRVGGNQKKVEEVIIPEVNEIENKPKNKTLEIVKKIINYYFEKVNTNEHIWQNCSRQKNRNGRNKSNVMNVKEE